METAKGCAICERPKDSDQAKKSTVFENDSFRVRHSGETNILGYLVLESKRHFLDLSESTDKEAQALGPVLKGISKALRKVLTVERIYTYTLAEMVPHFHIHVIPRTDAMPRSYRARGIMSYPLKPEANLALVEEICARLRRELRPLKSQQMSSAGKD